MVLLPSAVRFFAATTIAAVSFITTVDAHGTEVRQCVTPEGNLRFFVEHWHGQWGTDLSSPKEAGSMTIQGPSEQITGDPNGIINDQERLASSRWGCINDVLPTLVGRCSDEPYRNDWVYYEYPVTCNQQVSYTLLSGNTQVLEEACSSLYPATVSGTIEDSSPPVPKINGNNLPYTMTVMADSTESTSAVVSFTASATDDCDASPSVTTSIASGSSFQLGDTQVTVTATDDQSNDGTNTFTVRVISPPTTSPTPGPTLSPSSSPTANPSSIPSNSPSISHVPSLQPSENPSVSHWPTSQPSESPSTSDQPSSIPSESPSVSANPSSQPSEHPSVSNWPTSQPSENPSISGKPSSIPSESPSVSTKPSSQPSEHPSQSDRPTSQPSESPSSSGVPSSQQTENPSVSSWPTSASPTENPSITSSFPPSSVPSEQPTPSPTASPSFHPSSVPSEQPSIVEETTTITGNINLHPDMCNSSYTEAEQAAMCSAVQQTIQDMTCSTDDCEIQSVCCGTTSTEQRDRSLLSSRKLQETWQFQFTITETFTCKVASCDSPADTAAVDSILASVAHPMSDALADDTFVTILASNIDPLTLAVSPTCLVAWGAVGAPETVVSQPANNGVFYPDWKNDSGTCLQDGKEPGYMRINPTQWLSNSLEGCCEKYFSGWNKNKCLNEEGSGLWYVGHENNRCVVDCEQGNGPLCGGVISSLSEDLFEEPRSCCETHLGWIQSDFCEAESLRTTCYCGTKEWYRGDSAGSDTCVQDCDESCGGSTCGGIVKDNSIVLNKSAEKCCTEHYSWIEKDLCTARSTKTPIGKYYPDLLEGKCVKDSVTPTSDLSVQLYDTIEDCCVDINWLTVAECAAASDDTLSDTFFTFKYFVDWKMQKCVMDNGEYGSPTKFDDLFDDDNDCCAKIWWVDEDECVYEEAVTL